MILPAMCLIICLSDYLTYFLKGKGCRNERVIDTILIEQGRVISALNDDPLAHINCNQYIDILCYKSLFIFAV